MSMFIITVDDHPLITDSYDKFFLEFGYKDSKSFNYPDDCYEYVINNPQNYVFIIDYSIPESKKHGIKNGADLIIKLRKVSPDSKFIMFTYVETGIELFKMYKKCKLCGFWYKGDITIQKLLENLKLIDEGLHIITPTVQKKINTVQEYTKYFDDFDLDIILLLSKGVRNKDLTEYIPMSLSNINTRKSNIKIHLGVDNCNDDEFIKHCKEINLL